LIKNLLGVYQNKIGLKYAKKRRFFTMCNGVSQCEIFTGYPQTYPQFHIMRWIFTM